jgi:hypothetical protein
MKKVKGPHYLLYNTKKEQFVFYKGKYFFGPVSYSSNDITDVSRCILSFSEEGLNHLNNFNYNPDHILGGVDQFWTSILTMVNADLDDLVFVPIDVNRQNKPITLILDSPKFCDSFSVREVL